MNQSLRNSVIKPISSKKEKLKVVHAGVGLSCNNIVMIVNLNKLEPKFRTKIVTRQK